jgi:hypothetical protein
MLYVLECMYLVGVRFRIECNEVVDLVKTCEREHNKSDAKLVANKAFPVL